MVKEGLCVKVVEVSDGVVTVVVVFEEDVLRFFCWTCSTKWRKFGR